MNLILLINLALNKSEMINNIPKIKNTGSGNFFVMAGPCAIEGEEMAFKIAEKILDITSRSLLFLKEVSKKQTDQE